MQSITTLHHFRECGNRDGHPTTGIVKPMPATELDGFWTLSLRRLAPSMLRQAQQPKLSEPPSFSGTEARIYDRFLKDLCPKNTRQPIGIIHALCSLSLSKGAFKKSSV